MKTVKWLGQTIDNACMAACDAVYGEKSSKPDAAALIACFVTQCAGAQSAPPTVVPPPGFTLPAGTVLPGGLTIPAGWTIPMGTPLPTGPLPGGSFPPWWPPGIPTSIIPPGFVLPQNWTLPTNWTLPGPITLPTALTVPPGVPVPPNLPSVPPPPQTGQPPLPPAPTPIVPAEKKSDNTVLWIVGGGVAAIALVALLASSSSSLLENPGSGLHQRPDSGYAFEYGGRDWQFSSDEEWEHVLITPNTTRYYRRGSRRIDGTWHAIWQDQNTKRFIAQIKRG